MSKQFQVFDVGGDVFTLSVAISDAHVLKSPYFSSDESLFLREGIRTRRLEIATGENIQIFVRTVYDSGIKLCFLFLFFSSSSDQHHQHPLWDSRHNSVSSSGALLPRMQMKPKPLLLAQRSQRVGCFHDHFY